MKKIINKFKFLLKELKSNEENVENIKINDKIHGFERMSRLDVTAYIFKFWGELKSKDKIPQHIKDRLWAKDWDLDADVRYAYMNKYFNELDDFKKLNYQIKSRSPEIFEYLQKFVFVEGRKPIIIKHNDTYRVY